MNEWPITESVLSLLANGATVLAAIAAIVAVVLTVRQIKMTAAEMRDNAIKQRDDSEAQTRPYLAVDVVESLAGRGINDLIMVNRGKTVARDVHVTLAGDGFKALNAEDQLGPALGRLFKANFDLAPGGHRRVYWRFSPNENSRPSGEQGAPAKGEIEVTYRWVPDDSSEPREYQERIVYDLTEYPRVAPMPFVGATSNGGDVLMRNLDHAIRAVAQNVGELRR